MKRQLKKREKSPKLQGVTVDYSKNYFNMGGGGHTPFPNPLSFLVIAMYPPPPPPHPLSYCTVWGKEEAGILYTYSSVQTKMFERDCPNDIFGLRIFFIITTCT